MESLVLIKSLVIIVVILVVSYLVIIMVKKRVLYAYKNSEKKITILSYCRIDPKSSLTLVDVEGDKFLLASNGVNLVLKQIKNRLE